MPKHTISIQITSKETLDISSLKLLKESFGLEYVLSSSKSAKITEIPLGLRDWTLAFLKRKNNRNELKTIVKNE